MNVPENVDKREAEVRFNQELFRLHIFSQQTCLPNVCSIKRKDVSLGKFMTVS